MECLTQDNTIPFIFANKPKSWIYVKNFTKSPITIREVEISNDSFRIIKKTRHSNLVFLSLCEQSGNTVWIGKALIP
jgi:hypothetical protein